MYLGDLTGLGESDCHISKRPCLLHGILDSDGDGEGLLDPPGLGQLGHHVGQRLCPLRGVLDAGRDGKGAMGVRLVPRPRRWNYNACKSTGKRSTSKCEDGEPVDQFTVVVDAAAPEGVDQETLRICDLLVRDGGITSALQQTCATDRVDDDLIERVNRPPATL
jgi:hypothetical protein